MEQNEQIISAKDKTVKKYDEITMRLNEIKSVYSDISTAPEEVKTEIMLLSSYRGYLDQLQYGDNNMTISEDGYYISEWRIPNYLRAKENITEFYKKNGKKEYNPTAAKLKSVPYVEITEKYNKFDLGDGSRQRHNALSTIKREIENNYLESCSYQDRIKLTKELTDQTTRLISELKNKANEVENIESEKLRKFNEQKAKYEKLNPLRKVWYILTKQAIKVDGQYIISGKTK